MKILRPVFRVYQTVFSPAFTLLFDIRCRYEESCSRYMERMISEQGFRKGSMLGLKRLLSCNKWVRPFRRVHG